MMLEQKNIHKPFGNLFEIRSRKSWLIIFGLFVYFAFCWATYTATVEPLYGDQNPDTISADSAAYFQLAGMQDPSGEGSVDKGSLVSLGGSSLGPVAIAVIFRGAFGVACFNCVLFLVVIWWASKIPGVRGDWFALIMVVNPQTIPTLMTLNKEILAIAGMVAFSRYLYSRGASTGSKSSKSMLFLGIVFSILGRWQQVIIVFWYLAAESRWSPVRGKARWSLVTLLLALSIGYAAVVHILHINLQGFLIQTAGGGTIVRLNHIQDMGGYFLIAPLKILMNIAGRFVTPAYFLHDYWLENFGNSLQNRYIGILASLDMLITIFLLLAMDRLRASRPMIRLAFVYFICTAVNPFVQPRYMYPGFALLALELSRRRSSLEAVQPLPAPPPLPPSYRTEQTALAAMSVTAKH